LHQFHNILWSALKLFSLSFVPLLALGDATGSINAAVVQRNVVETARFCALIIAQDSLVSRIPVVLWRYWLVDRTGIRYEIRRGSSWGSGIPA